MLGYIGLAYLIGILTYIVNQYNLLFFLLYGMIAVSLQIWLFRNYSNDFIPDIPKYILTNLLFFVLGIATNTIGVGIV